MSVTVPTTPDFSLSLDASSIGVQLDSSSTVDIDITFVGGYSDTVTLSSEDEPTGVTVSFSPTSDSSTFTSTITVAADDTADFQTNGIKIKGVGADATEHEVALSVTVTECGNDNKEAGEECDGTDFNGATCSSERGTGSTGSLSCTSSCNIDISGCSDPPVAPASCTVQEGEASCTLDSADTGDTAIFGINDAEKLAITSIEVAFSDDVNNIDIDISKLPARPFNTPELDNSFEFYVFVSNLADSKIFSSTISFAVPKTWLSDNSIDDTSVALHRFENNVWNKLSTSKESEDTDFVFYEADSPGLSIFGINGVQVSPQCPVKPSDIIGNCIAQTDGSGQQEITTHTCSLVTDFIWEPQVTQQQCCPACPPTTTDFGA